MFPSSLLLVLAAAPALALAAANSTDVPQQVPASRPLLGYTPSNVLTSIATLAVALVAVAQVYLTVKYHAKWLLAMTIGCFAYAIGLASRFALARDPTNRTVFIVEYLLIVLAPCTFIAATYVLLGRLAHYLSADKLLLIRPSLVSVVFVTADIVTFLIQALGGSMVVGTDDPNKIKTGGNLFKLGLILQLVSFAFFIVLVVIFTVRVYKREPRTWTADKDAGKSFFHDWRALLVVLYTACLTIIIRSLYRTAEIQEGPGGKIGKTEWIFYAFDTLPLCICVGTYVPFWPGRFITPGNTGPGAASKHVPLDVLPQYGAQYGGAQYDPSYGAQYDGSNVALVHPERRV
ncbi:RTA1-domain-containing protein [Exidia glandulosa HHB12029]|uniref:RTA1-domain-containing protein n=1 Tax=Exidia glandulosa HHB12029 TaxID=1314781 RepID=A0A165ER24_EXIGL|nr:RTA1-domain-containing protein [Exidia glandulosa HHB12029]